MGEEDIRAENGCGMKKKLNSNIRKNTEGGGRGERSGQRERKMYL